MNDELNEIKILLNKLEKITEENNGIIRLITLSFHSLEDLFIKNWINAENINKNFYIKKVTKKVIQASENEVIKNRRARSAKLRVVDLIPKKLKLPIFFFFFFFN